MVIALLKFKNYGNLWSFSQTLPDWSLFMEDHKRLRDGPMALANSCDAPAGIHQPNGIASQAMRLAQDRKMRLSVRPRGGIPGHDPERLRLKQEVEALKKAWLKQQPRTTQ